MKNIKLSLCVLAVLSCFQQLNATPLDEVIKDVDVSGILRYRYYFVNGDATQTAKEYQNWGGSRSQYSNQRHFFRGEIGFSGAIADNFKIFTHFGYSSSDAGYGTGAVTNTSKSLEVRELYLIYTNEDSATKIVLGRQILNSIWSSPIYSEGYGKDVYGSGLIGEGVKITNTSIDGLTLSLFGYDSFSYDLAGLTRLSNGYFSDQYGSDIQADVGSWIARKNLYGASALGSYEVAGGRLNTELWLGYLPSRAIMYAATAAYKTKIFDDMNYQVKGTYLGNSVDDIPKRQNFKNGNFFKLDGTLTFNSWYFGAGILHYGYKDKKSFTVIEDVGKIDRPGVEIIYTNGSRLSGDLGENTFGYLSAGYTFFKKLRVTGGIVYGGTKVGEHEPFTTYDGNGNPTTLVGQAGKKSEVYGMVSYYYSPKLSFGARYSQVSINRKSTDGTKGIGRLEVLYKF